jgi:death on curing protein
MRYLALGEVVELHRLVLSATGGTPGIRDSGALESAVAQPRASFGGSDLHGILIEKAAALAMSKSGSCSTSRLVVAAELN